MFGSGAFFTNWHKRATSTLFFITAKSSAVPCFGLYSVPKNIGGVGKAWALTNASLSCIVTATSLFGSINSGVVLFNLGLVYLRAI